MKSTSKTLLLLFIILAFSASGQDLSEGLILHLPLSGNSQDYSENAFSVLTNDIEYTENQFGSPDGAALFNGTTSLIEFPNDNILKPELPVTFAFWIRWDSEEFLNQVVFNSSYQENINSGIFFMTTSSGSNFAVGFGDGSASYSASTRRSFVSNASMETGQWYHITIIVKGNTDMRIIIDCEDPGGNYSGSGGALDYSATRDNLGRHDYHTGFEGPYFQGAIS
ncbi:MAG: hypothetical protein HRT74_09050, partial [Flavobacteriales bacterium]|nr:hypothetical protein [Flavobacteriales bacterium]